jgi:serine/threonine-protein kinase
MQPPIKVGTILQNRYHIIHVLGQGGFGRTYLAEDQRRFNELCAIKELILATTEAYGGKKAQELFEREAATLYKIDHPQIPKFREKFAQDDRLFLVQDYVAGKTYHTLLVEYQAAGKAFTESEVLQLLCSLLPILEHIHKCGIIHRDISPDNLILRDVDKKPVLIDFGVVKELATRLSAPKQKQVTTVGKLGYSPSEQMQSGQAYPNSDLYALAVTAIVLLTAKEPAYLFDETALSWNWQKWVTVSPRFAEVLNRLLSYVPGDRYQSAKEVLSVLQSLDQPSVPQPNRSNLQTIAVGHRPDPLLPRPNRPNPVITPQPSSSMLDSPLAIGAIGSAVVILAGFGSWAVVNSIRHQSKTSPEDTSTPQSFPSPVIPGGLTSTPTPEFTFTPTPTPTNAEPIFYEKRLELGTSNTLKVDGTLKANEIVQYSFAGEIGQNLTVAVNQGSGVLVTVLAANGQPIGSDSIQVTSYQGLLLDSGQYTIQLSLSEGVAESDYSLSVALENPVLPTPTEILRPAETPTQIEIVRPASTPTPAEIMRPPETPVSTETPTPTETPMETPMETPTTVPQENNQRPETTLTPGFTGTN